MKPSYAALATAAVCGIPLTAGFNPEARAQKYERPVIAVLDPTQGNEANGTATFLVTDAGRVRVSVALVGLAPDSVHGIHIHERGSCGLHGEHAGGHFDPHGGAHGARTGRPRHAGDLGNITANAEGEVLTSFLADGITVGAGPANIVGRSIVVHAHADDLESQPSGNSGPRIACGVIGHQSTNQSAARSAN